MELRENLWTQSHKPYLVIYANYIINLSPILYSISLSYYLGFLGGSVVKNPLANAGDAEDLGSIPGSEDSLEKEMATHSSTLTWRFLWTEEPGGLYSP